jgi:hypothetical protein
MHQLRRTKSQMVRLISWVVRRRCKSEYSCDHSPHHTTPSSPCRGNTAQQRRSEQSRRLNLKARFGELPRLADASSCCWCRGNTFYARETSRRRLRIPRDQSQPTSPPVRDSVAHAPPSPGVGAKPQSPRPTGSLAGCADAPRTNPTTQRHSTPRKGQQQQVDTTT